MVVLCSGATSLFYIAHWQAYVSGTLKFGKFDVTEAQFTIIFIHLISAFFGCEFWAKKIFGIELRLFPMSFTVANECFVFLRDLKSILSGGAGKNGSTIAVNSRFSLVFLLSFFFLGHFNTFANNSIVIGFFAYIDNLFQIDIDGICQSYLSLYYYVWFCFGKNHL